MMTIVKMIGSIVPLLVIISCVRCQVTDELGDTWRNEILSDDIHLWPVNSLPITSIQVHGPQARPILVSDKNRDYVIIAVAEYGSGRVALTTHMSLLDNSTLGPSIEDWLTRGDDVEKITLTSSTDMSQVAPGSLLTFKGNKAHNTLGNYISSEEILQHVEAGGSFFYQVRGWDWDTRQDPLASNTTTYQDLLTTVGMFLAHVYFYQFPGTGMDDVTEYAATPENHVGLVADYIADNLQSLMNESLELEVPSLFTGHVPDAINAVLLRDVFDNFVTTLRCRPEDADDAILLNPTVENPVDTENKLAIVRVIDTVARMGIAKIPAPEFLGDVDAGAETITKQVAFDSADGIKKSYDTGTYLPRGGTLKITVYGEPPSWPYWEVRIGVHTDDLQNAIPLKRWPILYISQRLRMLVYEIYSPYGGLVHLLKPDLDTFSINATLEGVVEAPCYDLADDDSVAAWSTNQNNPAPWGHIKGNYIMFTLPRAVMQAADNIPEALAMWDEIVEHMYDFTGRPVGWQWAVPDVQITNGFMHAGTPIMTHMSISDVNSGTYVLNTEPDEDGRFYMLHEIGHNLRRTAWILGSALEPQANFFALYQMNSTCCDDVKLTKVNEVADYINSTQGFADTWAHSNRLPRQFYVQIQIGFGWEVFRTAFSQYELDGTALNSYTYEERLDLWYTRMSVACDRDLYPLFQFWRLPVGDEARESVAHLAAWLPENDVLLDINPTYTQQIRVENQLEVATEVPV